MNFLSSLLQSGIAGWVAIEQADAEADRVNAQSAAQAQAANQIAQQNRFNNVLIAGVTLAALAGVVVVKTKKA